MKYINKGVALSVDMHTSHGDFEITALCRCTDYSKGVYLASYFLTDTDSGLMELCRNQEFDPVTTTIISTKDCYKIDLARAIQSNIEHGIFDFSAMCLVECIERNNKYLEMVELLG